MNDLLFQIANITPKEIIVRMVKEAIEEWEVEPTKEAYDNITTMCHIITIKEVIDIKGGLSVLKEDMSKFEKVNKLFDFDNN